MCADNGILRNQIACGVLSKDQIALQQLLYQKAMQKYSLLDKQFLLVDHDRKLAEQELLKEVSKFGRAGI